MEQKSKPEIKIEILNQSESEGYTTSDSNLSEKTIQRDRNCKSQCRFCSKVYSSSGFLKKHEKRCMKNEDAKVKKNSNGIHNCMVCKQSFRYATGLERHEKRHMGEGGFICKQCDQKFCTDAERKLHIETIHNIAKCQLCDIKFDKDEDFFKHINTEHEGRDRLYSVCSKCGQQFRTSIQLKYHLESKCGTLKQWTCNKCDSKFMTKSSLRAHQLIHTGEKKYLCKFCGNSFLSKGQLKVHERSHTGEKPFSCEVCGKSFAYRESLVTHASIHTGIKPYLCLACGARFSCIGNLIKHRKARPDSCGLPQYCMKSVKVAPRPSAKCTRTRRPKNPLNIIIKPDILEECKNHINKYVDSDMSLSSCRTHIQKSCSNIITKYGNKFEDLGDNLSNKNEYSKFSDSMNDTQDKLISHKDMKFNKNDLQLVNPLKINAFIRNVFNAEKDLDDFEKNKNDITLKCKIEVDQSQYEGKLNKIGLPLQDDMSHANNSIHENGSDVLCSNRNINLDNFYDDEIQEDACHIAELESRKKCELKDFASDLFYATESINGRQLFSCKFCLKEYAYLSALRKHEKWHDGVIGNITGIKQSKIIKSKRNKPIYSCKYCYKKYLIKSVLLKHEKEHGPDGSLLIRCACCPQYFPDTNSCLQHQSTEHKDKLACKPCAKLFKRPELLMLHIKKEHNREPIVKKKYEYVCSLCGRKQPSKKALAEHEISHKDNIDIKSSKTSTHQVHSCLKCKRVYSSEASLRSHMSIHAVGGDKLQQLCRYCGKAFRTRGEVKVHERGHSGERPFQCEFCTKAFAYRESLITHRSIHTGYKRHSCAVCGARFSCVSNLQSHKKSRKNTCGSYVPSKKNNEESELVNKII